MFLDEYTASHQPNWKVRLTFFFPEILLTVPAEEALRVSNLFPPFPQVSNIITSSSEKAQIDSKPQNIITPLQRELICEASPLCSWVSSWRGVIGACLMGGWLLWGVVRDYVGQHEGEVVAMSQNPSLIIGITEDEEMMPSVVISFTSSTFSICNCCVTAFGFAVRAILFWTQFIKHETPLMFPVP